MNSCTPVILVTFLSNFVKEYLILYRESEKKKYNEKNLHEIEITFNRPLQGKRACIRNSEDTLFEILDLWL